MANGNPFYVHTAPISQQTFAGLNGAIAKLGAKRKNDAYKAALASASQEYSGLDMNDELSQQRAMELALTHPEIANMYKLQMAQAGQGGALSKNLTTVLNSDGVPVLVQGDSSGGVREVENYSPLVQTPEQKLEYEEKLKALQAQFQSKKDAAAPQQAARVQLAKDATDVYTKANIAAQGASRRRVNLESLKSLAASVSTGFGSETGMVVKRALGFDVSNAEELRARLGALAQEILNEQSGTKTDFDFKNAVKQAANMGNTNAGNAALLQALIRRDQETIAWADQVNKAYRGQNYQGILETRYTPPQQQTPQQQETSAADDLKKLGM